MLWKNKTNASRRDFIRTVSASAGVAAISASTVASTSDDHIKFTHGVASGDPTQTQIILWTRVCITNDLSKKIEGEWQISTEENFDNLTNSGNFKTGPQRDHTVKIDATDLEPGTTYYYRFLVEGTHSPTGTTKTLPDKSDAIDLAVVSCANYSHGYFNVYKELAEREFQAVLHLGDYIYEYGVGKYENPEAVKQGRIVKPKIEAKSLEDYRTRYAQYRSDPDLQAVHIAHPFICVWDDHEVANDSWKNGAENHSKEQGAYKARQKAAMRAYFEWLPIRETTNVVDCKIYRSFELAQLGTLIMMDTRHIGRDRVLTYQNDLPMRTIPFDMSDKDKPVAILDEQTAKDTPTASIQHVTVPFKLADGKATPVTDWDTIKTLDPAALPEGHTYLPDAEKFHSDVLGAEDRSIMGKEQEEWLSNELHKSTSSGKPWQILGQQLLAGKLGIPQISDDELDYDNSPYITREAMSLFRMLGQMGLPLNLDAWDGYPACRDRVFSSVTKLANNAVFLAGDTHNAWAFNLKDKDGHPVATELGTPSVSSPGLESYIPADPARVSEELRKVSSELHYLNNEDRGWLELSVTATELVAHWRFVSTVLSKSYDVKEGATFTIQAGTPTLI